ncbi:MAG: VCBS repeat-containing protein [Phycisphaerales bacterium]
MREIKSVLLVFAITFAMVVPMGVFGADPLNLGSEEFVQAGGVDISVGTYSVPSFVDWNNDNLKDFVIGTGSGYVNIYLNNGTEAEPNFSGYFRAQSNGSDLYCTPSGCMGCFPRVVYWDDDDYKDLLAGRADGTVKIFLNINNDNDPCFDGGTLLQVGPVGSKVNIDVGSRATSIIADWNSDGRKDLVVGAYDGRVHLFINEGTDTEPNFLVETYAQDGGADLDVSFGRSSPVVLDVDYDGRKDLLTGNTNGQLLFYRNVGTDENPTFSGYVAVESNGVPIDLSGTPRSRPDVCYWTGDGYFGRIDAYPDVLIGAYDGKVHLYQGVPTAGDIDIDGDVEFVDFAMLAAYWQYTSCGTCGGADLTGEGNVDVNDLSEFCDNWLAGVR